MNELQYKVNSYLYSMRNNDMFNIEEYILKSYQKFIEKIKDHPISITIDEFRIIISQIYDVLKLKVTIQEAIKSIECYLHSLSFDVTVGQVSIDSNWCIAKIHYLNWNNTSEITNKISEDIPFIKEKLYNTFQKEKGNRPKAKILRSYSRGI